MREVKGVIRPQRLDHVMEAFIQAFIYTQAIEQTIQYRFVCYSPLVVSWPWRCGRGLHPPRRGGPPGQRKG